VAVLLLNVQLLTVGLLLLWLSIPPPYSLAEFPLNVQPSTVGLLIALHIPPPQLAELPLKVQLFIVGLLLLQRTPPPHSAAELFVIVQLAMVQSPWRFAMQIPPPFWSDEFPLIIQLLILR
jgi:hypothetical protein